MKIETNFGVVYNADKLIIAIKTPDNSVFPSDNTEVFECETEKELNKYIEDNELQYPKLEIDNEEFTSDNN